MHHYTRGCILFAVRIHRSINYRPISFLLPNICINDPFPKNAISSNKVSEGLYSIAILFMFFLFIHGSHITSSSLQIFTFVEIITFINFIDLISLNNMLYCFCLLQRQPPPYHDSLFFLLSPNADGQNYDLFWVSYRFPLQFQFFNQRYGHSPSMVAMNAEAFLLLFLPS